MLKTRRRLRLQGLCSSILWFFGHNGAFANIDLHLDYIMEDGVPFYIDRIGNVDVEDLIASLKDECDEYNAKTRKKLGIYEESPVTLQPQMEKYATVNGVLYKQPTTEREVCKSVYSKTEEIGGSLFSLMLILFHQ